MALKVMTPLERGETIDERNNRTSSGSSARRPQRSAVPAWQGWGVDQGRTERVVEGRTLALSHLDKVLFPETGFTKGDLIDYYVQIAPAILTHIADRALTMKRYPNGVEEKFFYEKHAPPSRPEWLRTIGVSTADREDTIDYVVVDNVASLVWVANLATVELHVPLWHVGRRRRLPGPPDFIVFDLDPGPGASIVECCEVALLLEHLFEGRDIEIRAKTSGSKGLQLYGAAHSSMAWDETRAMARDIADDLAVHQPHLVVSNMRRELRQGKVLIDWSQNHPAKTMVGAYSLRGKTRPEASAPVTWDEVRQCRDAGDPAHLAFGPADVLARVAELGDLFAH